MMASKYYLVYRQENIVLEECRNLEGYENWGKSLANLSVIQVLDT